MLASPPCPSYASPPRSLGDTVTAKQKMVPDSKNVQKLHNVSLKSLKGSLYPTLGRYCFGRQHFHSPGVYLHHVHHRVAEHDLTQLLVRGHCRSNIVLVPVWWLPQQDKHTGRGECAGRWHPNRPHGIVSDVLRSGRRRGLGLEELELVLRDRHNRRTVGVRRRRGRV